MKYTDGVFGVATPTLYDNAADVTDDAADDAADDAEGGAAENLADIYLGYVTPPAADAADDDADGDTQGAGTQPAQAAAKPQPEQPQPGQGGAPAQPPAGAGDPAVAWQQEKAQYEQALAYMAAVMNQMAPGLLPGLGHPMAPAPAGAQVIPGAMPQPASGTAPQHDLPTVQQTFGLPIGGPFGAPTMAPPGAPFVPYAGAQPALGHMQPAVPPQQTAAQPAAQDEGDEDLDEQFYTAPTKAAESLLEKKLPHLFEKVILPKLVEREAFFGQALGQLLIPVFERVQFYEWATRLSQEHHQLMEQYGDDYEAVLPDIRAMLKENPQLVQQMRVNPQQVNLTTLYHQAKQRGGTRGGQRRLQTVPGGKGVARMPQAGAGRVRNVRDDNDALVEAALGPAEAGGVFG